MGKKMRYFGLIILALTLWAVPLAHAGSTTTHGYFYKPSYGEKGPAGYVAYNAALDATDIFLHGLAPLPDLIANWVGSVDSLTLIEIAPAYSAGNTFTLAGDYSTVLTAGKRLVADCGADGLKPNTVISCTYGAPTSTVVVTASNLTNNLAAVSYYATRNGLNTYGSGDVVASEYGSPSWANLQSAVAVANASGRRLLLTPGTWPVSDNLAITAPVHPVPGALLQVATTKTLTLSNDFQAGLYQAFSCVGTGAVSFTGTQTVNAAWFGLNDDATTDDYGAILLAYNATPTGGTLEFPRPVAGFALATTWTIAKPINIKFNSDAYYLEIGLSTLCTPTFVWTGGAAPVITISNAAGVWFHGNAAIDCNATATFGLYADRARYGGWKGKLLIHDPATAGMKLYTTPGAANDNTMWMDFDNVQVMGPKGLIMDSSAPATGNCCHNKFGRLQVNYTGDDAIDLIACDNNAFDEVFLYRSSGAGNGLRLRANAQNNVFNHFQGPVGIGGAEGTGTCLVDADCRFANVINSYDKLNGQALPNFTPTSLSASATYKWTASGSGTGEFYLELAAGGNPGIYPYKPLSIIENSVYLREGFLGFLEASQWGYGDNDTLGYTTIYVRLADNADPDGKAENFLRAILCDLAYTDQGGGSFGDYKRKTYLQGDMLVQAKNGSAIELYDDDFGDGIKVLLNPVTHKFELYSSVSGGGYLKMMDIARGTGLRLYGYHDVRIMQGGQGIVLTNAAGTVTKRVRLNDAGDGLIFEAP